MLLAYISLQHQKTEATESSVGYSFGPCSKTSVNYIGSCCVFEEEMAFLGGAGWTPKKE